MGRRWLVLALVSVLVVSLWAVPLAAADPVSDGSVVAADVAVAAADVDLGGGSPVGLPESFATGVTGPGGSYVPLAPVRVLDTRNATQGEVSAAVGRRQTVAQRVAGTNGVPADAAAVAINITAVTPTAAGYLTVWPSGQARPTVSSINFPAGAVVGNFVIAEVGEQGRVNIYNHEGSTHVVFDVVGYVPNSADYVPLVPARVLDTRNTSQGELSAPVGERQTVAQRVAGVGGVPANAKAVAINITAVTPSRDGFLTVWPSGRTRPGASSINFGAGEVVGNFVFAEVGANGRVSIYNHNGATDVVFDVVGYFPAGANYTPLTPARVLDTRNTTQGELSTPVGRRQTRSQRVAGVGGVPADASAVAINITAVTPTASGFLTVWPSGRTRPEASSINFPAGGVVGNFVIAEVGANGRVDIYNHEGNTHVVFDVVGYYPTAARTQIGAGSAFTCALDAEGDPWCWGTSSSGALGNGTTTTRLVPVRVSGLRNLTQLSAGDVSVCGIDQEGTAWCWGNNGTGRLGDGTTTNRLTPVRVAGLPPVVKIAVYGSHTCAIDRDQQAWCWGSNGTGQLGDGTTAYQRTTAALVQNLPAVVDIAVGGSHTCALDTGGESWCWGSNNNGQLGDGNVVSGATPRPQRVVDLPNARALDGGSAHTCAIAASGGAQWCWGGNSYGVLGDGTNARRPLPAQSVGLSGVRSTSVTSNHRCATDGAWRPWCWGYNYLVGVGDGTTMTHYAPVAVAELNRVRQVAAGGSHSCAVDHAGAPWCWGRNNYGQLGDGTTVNRLVPVRVTPYS
jgi:alpha-tubulin suppressor-like RCC1 family protein